MANVLERPGAMGMAQPPMAGPMIDESNSDDYKQELMNEFNSIRQAEEGMNVEREMVKGSRMELKRNMLKLVFDAMIKAGVKPDDPASLSKFLENLKNTNPDAYELFESSFAGLLDGLEGDTPQVAEEQPGGLPPGGLIPEGLMEGPPPEGALDGLQPEGLPGEDQ